MEILEKLKEKLNLFKLHNVLLQRHFFTLLQAIELFNFYHLYNIIILTNCQENFWKYFQFFQL